VSREIEAIAWVDGAIRLLDQTLIPVSETYVDVKNVDSLIDAIQRLVIRGAPALGVAGAYGVALARAQADRDGWNEIQLQEAIDRIRDARPTAVNLAWGVNQVRALATAEYSQLLSAANAIAVDDKNSCASMANNGADWLIAKFGEKKLRMLTHCNTGSLATAGVGTALGVIREMHSRGQVEEVIADETRPLLQGSRLTAWELSVSGIPYRIEPDGAAASAILSGKVDVALIGADRIARNGDSANKIGSLGVALACKEAGIPFLVVAPESTVDRTIADGSSIVIEERPDEEITFFGGVRVAPDGAQTFNPAFDVTPARFISAVITDSHVYEIAQGAAL
jgi:methylthioribose-1-phosphate isomerase